MPVTEATPDGCYYIAPMRTEEESFRRNGKPRWVSHQFNLFPLVLCEDGSPWQEATVYILSRIENALSPRMGTFSAIADDLTAYRRFLDETGLDWTVFPRLKLQRPTYRFNGHLRFSIEAGEIAASTAKRRIGTVVAFYSWLRDEGAFTPDNEPWIASDRFIRFKDAKGFEQTKKVMTTDLAIAAPKQDDPYGGTIEDGGRLRPLPQNEQQWLIEALKKLDNPEMTLIHLLGLITGARIQSVLTLRVRHVKQEVQLDESSEIRLPIGGSTGVDTKNDKQMVLTLPVWFYNRLRTYALSERATRRRLRASDGDNDEQYLFMSTRGSPLYENKRDAQKFDALNTLRHSKSGQAVRQFIKDRLVPCIRTTYSVTAFHFQFHDLRATFGMNLTDWQLELVASGKTTLHQAREFVKARMGHNSAATTDRYLQYRQNLQFIRTARGDYENRLIELANTATRYLDA